MFAGAIPVRLTIFFVIIRPWDKRSLIVLEAMGAGALPAGLTTFSVSCPCRSTEGRNATNVKTEVQFFAWVPFLVSVSSGLGV